MRFVHTGATAADDDCVKQCDIVGKVTLMGTENRGLKNVRCGQVEELDI
tara:strand:+ start:299 stop:445 length:147 start_codon:yes stop_codon:yes gene_type:complete